MRKWEVWRALKRPKSCAEGNSSLLLDFLKVVRLVFWSGVVGPQLSLARASRSLARAPRSYDRASRSQSRYALKSSTCEQV